MLHFLLLVRLEKIGGQDLRGSQISLHFSTALDMTRLYLLILDHCSRKELQALWALPTLYHTSIELKDLLTLTTSRLQL
jgi:hypothetical protein